ncbi:GAF domain-containing protein [Uliginosibacterium sp. sgz301328]|uniref:GAF domain-containing protein n=1 Tax=Uliginosibacterium sp. sgz301328 TaxID=3243764 RepID=UPI00359D9C1D
MSAASVDAIRNCLEGAIPSTLATCSPDGVPNVTYVSQVEYVDHQHVALSFQFFSKTRENILLHPFATAYVTDGVTGASYRLSLQFLHTQTEGWLFERMKAKLAGIASHSGLAGVFRLLGSDVYRVLAIERVPGGSLPAPAPRRNLLSALRAASEALCAIGELSSLLDQTLQSLDAQFGIAHSMLLMFDAAQQRLYTVATHGYAESGVGFEIGLGEGVIGVAAQHRVPIRIAHMTNEYSYARAVRDQAIDAGFSTDAEVPFVGLAQAHSQMAVPILAADALVGVLYVESPEQQRFSYDDEDALVTLARQVGLAIRGLQCVETAVAEDAPRTQPVALQTQGVAAVRHFAENDSVFIDNDYIIKGVAGAILWRLLGQHAENGRTEFSNRELRLDAALRLPDIDDNLEARLILLSRRLDERCDFLAIEKTGRGRFRLKVGRRLELLASVPR